MYQKYPLPIGVDDAVLNRTQLARAMNVSEPTIDRWIADGMPIIEAGTNGRSYKFQLLHCWAWKCARDEADVHQSEESERSVRQMRMALIGGAVGNNERVLSAKERGDLFYEESRWMSAAQLRRELIPVQDVRDMMEETFVTIRDGLSALPDRLARECSLNGRQIEKAIAACDDVLFETQRRVRDMHLDADTPPQIADRDLSLN